MRVMLMSTPEFGLPTLRALMRRGHDVVGVICQPDKPAGRGLRVSAPPMKRAALELGIPVFQPTSLSRPEVVDSLRKTEPSLILVAAYGNFIPDVVCRLAPRGCINLHPSLLPRWRGACPVVSAILAGDAEAGVTVHFVVKEMDAGDILGQARLGIVPEETAGDLMRRLADLGGDFFLDTVEQWLSGEITPRTQDHSLANWCDRMTKQQGLLDWSRPASYLARQVRAFNPWPGAYTFWQGRQLDVVEAVAVEGWQASAQPGQVVQLGDGLAVATGSGALRLCTVQLAGKRIMPVEQFVCGARGFLTTVLGR